MLTLTRISSVPLPRLMPLLQSVPLPKFVPPLQDVREAVERDVRGLWAGMEAFQALPAANDETIAPAPSPAAAPAARAFRPPLGWVSLAAAGALFAALGFAQMQVQHHLSASTTLQQPQKQRPATRKHKKLRRVRAPERTDYSRGT